MDGRLFEAMLRGTRLDVYDYVFRCAVEEYGSGGDDVIEDLRRWRKNELGRMYILGWFLYMYGDVQRVWAPLMVVGAKTREHESVYVNYYLDHVLENLQTALHTRCDVWEYMSHLRVMMETAVLDHDLVVARGVVEGDKGIFCGGEAGRGVDADPDGVFFDGEGGGPDELVGEQGMEEFL